jgi:hypothetical protein
MVANAYNKKPIGSLTIGVVSDSQLIWMGIPVKANIDSGGKANGIPELR